MLLLHQTRLSYLEGLFGTYGEHRKQFVNYYLEGFFSSLVPLPAKPTKKMPVFLHTADWDGHENSGIFLVFWAL